MKPQDLLATIKANINLHNSLIMRIHTDKNGLYVNAISKLSSGEDVLGNLYQVTAGSKSVDLKFQTGSPLEVGVNGLTNEALLSILINRLGVLNAKFSCKENHKALTLLECSLEQMELRTKRREERGVEGKLVA